MLERYLLEKVGARGSANSDVEEWRNSPFQPHLVARARPMAYMKWFVFKHIEILTAYGDYYFRQNTLDSYQSQSRCTFKHRTFADPEARRSLAELPSQ